MVWDLKRQGKEKAGKRPLNLFPAYILRIPQCAKGGNKSKLLSCPDYLIAAFTANWNLIASKSSVMLTPSVR